MNAIAMEEIAPVGIVDDEDEQAEALQLELTDAGIESHIIPIRSRSFEAVVADFDGMRSGVCDHVLRKAQVGYTGAMISDYCNKQLRKPTVLITGFPMDNNTTIRLHRSNVPVVLDRESAEDVECLLGGIRTTLGELRNGRPPSRDTVRTAITIERVLKDSGIWVADATVGGWEREDAVRFPMKQLPEPYRTEDPESAEGKIFFCWANLEIEEPDELFFEAFEDDPAPEELIEFP
jgi:hypothetical protein